MQECSPYAAHLYDAEDANTPMRLLPGLCGDYCADYWHQCRYTLSLLLEDLGVLHQLANATVAMEEDRTKFCDFLELKDKQYCYPSVVSNTGIMPSSKMETMSERCFLELVRLYIDRNLILLIKYSVLSINDSKFVANF